jgi:hypothetical protein
MVRLFMRHNVDDYEAWRRMYDEFDARWTWTRAVTHNT